MHKLKNTINKCGRLSRGYPVISAGKYKMGMYCCLKERDHVVGIYY